MNLASELGGLGPRVRVSAWPGHEHVRGYGVMGMPLSSGGVLALRVFPESDFAPYTSVWLRDPEGEWSIFVDGPRLDTACPRYFGPAVHRAQHAQITLTWTGPADLRVQMDRPELLWEFSVEATLVLRLLNALGRPLPLSTWRSPKLVGAREWVARRVLGMGDMKLSATMPSGHFGTMMPERIYFIERSEATLDGVDLGEPVRVEGNPRIGEVPLPARPVFAVGQAHWRIRDRGEYERVRQELARVGRTGDHSDAGTL